MTKPVVLVLGATGNIGKATVKHLSEKYGGKLEIRAGTRNPAKVPAELNLPNVKIVKAAVGDDRKHLKDAFHGVDNLFIIPPTVEFSADIVREAVAVAKEAGIKHVLLLGASSADLDPKHKYAPFGGSFNYIEKRVKELFPNAVVVHATFFMENNLALIQTIKEQQKVILPLIPDAIVPWMAVEDAGTVCGDILSDPGKHSGKRYAMVNDRKSYNDFARFLSEAVGKKIDYVQIPYEKFHEVMLSIGMPEWLVDTYSRLYHLVDEKHSIMSFDTNKDFYHVTGSQPMTLKQWCTKYADNFK